MYRTLTNYWETHC